jgi:hypothetical protein
MGGDGCGPAASARLCPRGRFRESSADFTRAAAPMPDRAKSRSAANPCLLGLDNLTLLSLLLLVIVLNFCSVDDL